MGAVMKRLLIPFAFCLPLLFGAHVPNVGFSDRNVGLSNGLSSRNITSGPAGPAGPAGNINSWSDLAAVGTNATTLDGNYTLGTDLSSSSSGYTGVGDMWGPIGDSTDEFTGTFDGQGYSISDLIVPSASYTGAGLFGYMDGAGAIIQNLAVIDCSVTNTGDRTGSIVGAVTTGSTITNCYSTGSVSGANYIGGAVGYIYAGTISYCYTTVTVSASGTYAGGLIGRTLDSAVSINSCFSVGGVTIAAGNGGFVGDLNTARQNENGWYDFAGNPDFPLGDKIGIILDFETSTLSDFYLSTFDIYDTGTYTWDFATPVWYVKAGALPVLRGQQ